MLTQQMYEVAYEYGYNARLRNEPRNNNPYINDRTYGELHQVWLDGWDEINAILEESDRTTGYKGTASNQKI